jgi:hypothetical protein
MRIANVLFSLIIAIGVFLPLNTPAHGSTTTLTITGEGSETGGVYSGAPATFVNMQSDDGDTTHIYGYDSHAYEYHSWTKTASPVVQTVDGVTLYYKARYGGTSSTVIPYCYIGGTRYTGSTQSLTSSHVLYSCNTFNGVTNRNPSNGAVWTKATLDAAEFGLGLYYDTGVSGTWLTYVYIEEVYTDIAAPTVTTQAVSTITPTTATGNGNVTSNGGSAITEKGIAVCLESHGTPDSADALTVHDHVDSTGAFTEAIVGLTKGTAYHGRAYAVNAIGTSYGSTEDFTTIGDPTISTSAASLVTATTARLNSSVTFDGSVVTGEPCTVTFVYVEDGAGAPYANYAAVLAEGVSSQTAVAGTWITGQNPYLDISALTVSGDYSFAVKIINSTATTAYGSVLTFTTESGVYIPTNFTAIPTASTVSLLWTKGIGAQYTMVRYSDSTYPATITDGIVAYLDTGNSKTVTGLTAGTTYYFSAWGKTGTVYSGTPATYADGEINTIVTTLAYDTAGSTGTIEAPPSNSWWNQTPSAAKVGSIPVVSALVSQNATVYAIPEASLWYFLWVLFSVGMGVVIYVKSQMNLVAGLGSQALLFALGAVLGLTMLWIMVIFMVIGAGFTLWGNRH